MLISWFKVDSGTKNGEGFTVNLDTKNAMFGLALGPPQTPTTDPPGWQWGRAGKGLPCDNDNAKPRIGAMPCAKMTKGKGKKRKKGLEQILAFADLSHTPTGRRIFYDPCRDTNLDIDATVFL